MLESTTLPNGWTIKEKLKNTPGQTGGNFSCGYIVEDSSGRKGFLKAMDYASAFAEQDAITALKELTTAYDFEKRLCIKCRDNKVDNVVHPIDHGYVLVDIKNPYSRVEFIVFELADGDIRNHLSKLTPAADKFMLSWILRTLHGTCNGLRQLHQIDITHRDLKPSNILIFENNLAKVADLGCAGLRGFEAPRDVFKIAGDRTYAPVELHYGYKYQDIYSEGKSSDLYQLGSMIVFFVTGVCITSMLKQKIPIGFAWSNQQVTFDLAKPYLSAAFEQVLNELRIEFKTRFPTTGAEKLLEELIQLVKELSTPNPIERGDNDRRARGQDPYDLNYYVTRFDRVASRAEAYMGR